MAVEEVIPTEELCCGLVMPISSIDGCNEQHWSDVKEILTESVESAGFKANLVSYADDVGIIQKRIIQNLYENPIVVCDVSGKNPNVMFELGMRLAFDKPTIIVKDDKTAYSFDTSPIEHLEYPRDLRFSKIVDFKEALKEKVKATLRKSKEDANYTAFLKHFGTFTVAKLDTKEVSKEDFIIEELRDLKKSVHRQTLMYNDRFHSIEPAFYGRYPSEKLYMVMKNLIKKTINNSSLNNSSINYSISKKNLPEIRKKIYSQLMNDEQIQHYFSGPEEFDMVFNEVCQDLLT
ncbi:RNA helicase [Nitrincola sp. A-D6]|uniref:hypothetical protein n=1 Tax=Nitrincola sp. A-D6 TaxID=1545442 RepID=UPI00051FF15C|nr:hypothetical protein [Nitrincola sp. A-D6]KGK43041.1 RNA helicase [Nitrincola sp. A-D6]